MWPEAKGLRSFFLAGWRVKIWSSCRRTIDVLVAVGFAATWRSQFSSFSKSAYSLVSLAANAAGKQSDLRLQVLQSIFPQV